MVAVRDVLIIGSGPSGYTAAVYAARAGLAPLVFEGAISAGGSLMNTTDVENYPGFPEGVMGPDLMDRMRQQAEKFGAEFIPDDVSGVVLGGDVKTVLDTDGSPYSARTVILATGSRYRKLGLPSEQRLSGRGVSWCATCDGFFFRDKDVVVVGGGDSALEEATFLTRFANTVTIIHRRDAFRASKIMQDRAKRDEKISVLWNRQVIDIMGDQKVTGLRLRDTDGREEDWATSGIFVAIGHEPRTELVTGQVALTHTGYIAVEGRSSRTNINGVFACGDVVDHQYRQAITAAGSGCSAALDAERYLAALGDCGSCDEARIEAMAIAELVR
ncbi:thioredoxin-disulfide reductase [Streptomyces griseoluteus]|jgi:thioredoxin reductase (NADPH)|uniref:thioredoxin-disulfide reductase n=1 Tax=Streptomyces TaxID=1883 RepID=UPI000A39A1F0|nr:thioredoxin-disulfide reductase [Streptomyces recifensis]